MAVLRIIRLLRLVRLVKLMRSCKDVWLLVVGLANGLKTLVYVGVLMVIALYTCAIFCVQMIGKDPRFAIEEDEGYDDAGQGSSYDEGEGGHGSSYRLLSSFTLPERRLKVRGGDDLVFDPIKYFGDIPRSMFTLWECLNDGCTADIVRLVVMKKPLMSHDASPSVVQNFFHAKLVLCVQYFVRTFNFFGTPNMFPLKDLSICSFSVRSKFVCSLKFCAHRCSAQNCLNTLKFSSMSR